MKDSDVKNIVSSKYKYGFNDGDISVLKMKPGLNHDVIKQISAYKNEPKWMLDFRLKAYEIFLSKPNPSWGPDLSKINFEEYTYYLRATQEQKHEWDEIPEKIKNTFARLGIPEAEQKFLSGVSTQYESEVVYHSVREDLAKQNVIFQDTDTALKEHPELFKKYFASVVPYSDNKYAALNSAVWSGGSFIYVPKNTKVTLPLQSYFRINSQSMGQFERTLIICDENSEVHYIEGCTAPKYLRDSLHSAVVEIVVLENAKVKYTTIQNWSSNVFNMVTKRSLVHKNGNMMWVDGNIGSKVNMKYPSCILLGDNASGSTISVAVAQKDMVQDAGAKMIHIGKNTKSSILSKTIAYHGGRSDYRGLVDIQRSATNSYAKVECDTLLLDEESDSATMPTNNVGNNTSILEHEATITKLSDTQLFYLMSRGLSEEQATEIIVLGFLEPFAKELPMEYAVELNQLIKLEMENAIG